MNKIVNFFENAGKKEIFITIISSCLVIALIVTSIITVPRFSKNKTVDVDGTTKVSITKKQTTTEKSSFEVVEVDATSQTTTTQETTVAPVKDKPQVLSKNEYTVVDTDKKEDGKTDGSQGSDTIIDGGNNNINQIKPPVPSKPDETQSSAPDESSSGETSATTPPPTTLPGKTEIPKGNLVGWTEACGNLYYFDNNHNYLMGMQTINSIKYRFNNYGAKSSKLAIDVSNHNGDINWAEVRRAGVEYAIIRVGFRGYRNGKLMYDTTFKYNIKNALANGIQVGVYFYSQAITDQEAIEEASLAVNSVQGYGVKLPIYFDTEFTEVAGTSNPGRADRLSAAQRTHLANVFCETVRGAGYKAGVYASKFFYYDNLIYSQLTNYYIWLAHYTNSTDFRHSYSMWQYTEKGTVIGIKGNVDVNICLYDFVNNNDMSRLGEDVVFI